MKTRYSLGSLGVVVAILSSLNLSSNSRAGDREAKLPQALNAVLRAQHLTAFSADGEFYAVASPDGRIRYGGTRNGEVTRLFHLCYPRTVVFSPDGRLLAAAGESEGIPCPKVWQVADGRLLCKVGSDLGGNPVLSFSPDSTLLASSGDGLVRLWTFPTGMLRHSEPADKPVLRLAFTKGGKSVLGVCADGSILHFPVH